MYALRRERGAGPRSAADLKKAATHFERAAALHTAPVGKAVLAGQADLCRTKAGAMKSSGSMSDV